MKPHRIERLYAWIVTDSDGEDGIPSLDTGFGPLPMIGSDKVRIESLRASAEALAYAEGYPLRLVEFTGAVVLESLPGSPNPPKHR